jgi:nucleotide-binding universal stress UspA family protein
MKKILVATDFSPVAQQATDYAADLARATKADLLLFHVVSLPVTYTEIPFPAESIIPDLIKNGEIELERVKTSLLSRTGGSIRIDTEVRMGSTVNELCDYCDELKPYAVVMGMHSGPVERLFFGSNSLAASRRLTSPLIIIPPGAGFTTIRKIGLACDFKKMSETVPVKEINQLVKDLNAELHVLHVSAPAEQWKSSEISEKWLWLKSMFSEIHATYNSLQKENVEAGIIEFADNNKLDLLIIIPKKHSLTEKLFLKSHTKHLVTHSHMPVMSMHE